MRIVVLCATRRGLLFLNRLLALVGEHEIVVFSFREEPHEPPFLDAIRVAAEAGGAHFYEAKTVGAPKWAVFWDSTPFDLLFTVSWRYLIPAAVYEKARLGAFVFHDSLLPAYRGFAPTVWAMVNGEDHTGVTLFRMAEAVDSGDIVAQQRVPIGPDETIAEVMERVTDMYLDLLETTLPALLTGSAPRVPQDQEAATFTCKRLPEDNAIDWTADTASIYNLIRAVTAPYPGAYTTLAGNRLVVWGARRVVVRPYVGRVPGRVVEIRPGEGVVVLTGDGELLLTDVQPDGQPRQPAADVLNSLNITLGR